MAPAIIRRVAELHGEKSGIVLRCPGMSCSRWRDAKGTTYDEKARVCRGCDKCNDNPPLRDDEHGFRLTKSIEDQIVRNIENLRLEMKTFPEFDFSDLDYVEIELLKVWEQQEELYKNVRESNLTILCKQILAMQS